MPFAYPVFLELGGRKAAVIGEAAVRDGKVEGLLAGGASQVLVVATAPPSRLDALEREHEPFVTVARRGWQPSDLDGAFIVIASDPARDERDAIAREARRRGALVNVIDDVSNCDWAAPSVVRRGDLAIAVSTGGRSPALARRLRQELEEQFGDEWGELLDVLRQVREQTIPALPDLAERSRRWSRALDLEEAQALMREGRRRELAERLRARLMEEPAG